MLISASSAYESASDKTHTHTSNARDIIFVFCFSDRDLSSLGDVYSSKVLVYNLCSVGT